MDLPTQKGLPENAYRELKEGESYEPIIKHDQIVPEITIRSVVVGLIMCAIFSAAAAFLGLKVATVFEAAIPIAILAVGLSFVFPRKSTILENVIIQSIGAASGVVVAGAIFTIPALFILGLEVNLLKIFLVALFGGFLGILFMVLFRKYFVSDMHGKFPFPEATATTEILVAGEKGGKQAVTLAVAMVVGAIYDFMILTGTLWSEVFTSKIVPLGAKFAEKAKLVFKFDTLASIIGLGYIVGLRYSAIICAGSFLSWFVLIPLVSYLGRYSPVALPPVTDGTLISSMTAEQIFRNYVRLIGIGGIACAGIIGILKSSKIIWQAMAQGIKQIFKSKASTDGTIRTNTDIKFGNIFIIIGVLALTVFLFFRMLILKDMSNATTLAMIALLVVFIISFLFTSVAARAIAIVGTNPVSGMTLMTLILSSIILVKAGLSGNAGMLAALLIGGVVCTSLSMAGGFITDLKIGYWIGATPRNQQRWKFLGTLVAALSVGAVIMLLNNTYGFVATPEHANPLPAPQANAMAAVIKTLMSNEPVPWVFYGLGVLIAIILEIVKIPPLAFALGMYIPLELNTPLFLGGILSYIVAKSTKDTVLSKARSDKGILIASGFIAGGAIMGIVDALTKWFTNAKIINFTFLSSSLGEKPFGQYLAIFMVIALSIFVITYANSAKKED